LLSSCPRRRVAGVCVGCPSAGPRFAVGHRIECRCEVWQEL
jgi:hypothetical protein